MSFVLALLSALAAIPKIGAMVEQFAAAVTLWLVQRSNNQTLSAISDAASLASRATNDNERYLAAQAWRDALSRARVSPQ